jgi:hypothetical protein
VQAHRRLHKEWTVCLGSVDLTMRMPCSRPVQCS